MLQPVNLQLAHFNVEHSAQISKDALAAAQQTGQTKEAVQESVKRTQIVQATEASAELQKVRRKGEDDRERRRDQQQRAFSDLLNFSDADREEASEEEFKEEFRQKLTQEPEELKQSVKVKQKTVKGFDFYA
jgi:hypothetical protein